MEETSGNRKSPLASVLGELKRRYCLRVERREAEVAARTTDRVVREFEWGLDWARNWPCAAGVTQDGDDPAAYLRRLRPPPPLDDGPDEGFGEKGECGATLRGWNG